MRNIEQSKINCDIASVSIASAYTEPLHGFQQGIVAWLWPKDAAHDAAHGFACIRESHRGLGFYGNDDIDGASHDSLLQTIIHDVAHY